MAGAAAQPVKRTKRRARSTIRDQEAVLRVLGVLKVATATQIQALVRPHLTDNKPFRNALLDLAARDEVESEGSTAGPSGRFGAPDRTGEPSQKLWVLKPKGLDAATRLLGRTPQEMGGRARGAGRGGAPHAMAVNATIVAFAQAGVGDITSWRTEVAHALAGSGKQNVRADAVLRAAGAGVPLLMVEVDLNTEPAARVAGKLAAYAALYRRRVNDPAQPGNWTARRTSGAGLVPFWQTLYPDTGLPGWPPLAMVFTGRGGPRAMANRMQAVADLSHEHWAAQERRNEQGDGYLDFTGRVPLVMTTLDQLREHGPHGPAWHRVAQRRGAESEPLLQALADTHTPAEFWRRDNQRRIERQAREEAERAAAQAEVQRMWDDDPDDEEGEPEEAACATPDCGRLLSVRPNATEEATAPVPIPPEDGTYCWACRLNRDYWDKPGLRGALRRMWHAPGHFQ